MKRAGRPHVKLAFNEWGLGYVQNGNEFDHALVASDFMIELFRNPVYQACYWNLNMGNKHTRVLHTRKRGIHWLNLILWPMSLSCSHTRWGNRYFD